MCISKIAKRQSFLFCKRAYLGTKRRPGVLFTAVALSILLFVIGFNTYSASYDEGSLGSNSQEKRKFVTYSPRMGVKDDQENFLPTCRKWGAHKIGLINPINPSEEHPDPAFEIYENLKLSMTPEEQEFFNHQSMTREDLPKLLVKEIDNLQDAICLAIVVNDYSKSGKKYNVTVSYAPAWVQHMPSNMTSAQESTYNWLWWNDAQQLGYLRVMAAVADTVIENHKQGDFSSMDINYNMTVLPAATGPQPGTGDWAGSNSNWNMATSIVNIAIPIYEGIIADKNEKDIIGLSRVMGLKMTSKALFWIYLTIVAYILVGLPFEIVLKVLIYKHTDWSIYLFGQIVSKFQSLSQTIALMTIFGPLTTILWNAVLPIFYTITFGNLFSVTPMPVSIAMVVGLVIPGSTVRPGFEKLMNLYESMPCPDGTPGCYTGLQWSNILSASVDNGYGFLFPYVSINLSSSLIWILIFIWQYPRVNIKDGKTRGCCYCFSRELTNFSDVAIGDDETTPLLQDAPKQILLEHEMELFKEGKLEHPNLQQQIEEDPNYLQAALRINSIKKSFKNLDKETAKEIPYKPAVNDLSMSMFKDQIFVLLGHNGAGKTTTIKMLTGFDGLTPDEGQVQAFGLDLLKQKDQASKIIGFCPQHDALIFNMTVWENLQWFLGMRGLTDDEIKDYADKWLPKVDMKKKLYDFVGKLSGGQKRKLQLLIALSCNAKFILLDEPSSGMDPTARRETWDLIKKEAKGKIILLTTHYMDEAEALGDRIAVMSKGRLQTCGSSMFLKDKYGLGVLLEVDPIDKNQSMDQLSEFLQGYLDDSNQEEQEVEQAFGQVVGNNSLKHVQGISVVLDEADKFKIVLPRQLNAHFTEIFQEIDNPENNERFNLNSYNIRVTSLEEVFNKLGEDELAAEIEGQAEGKMLPEQEDVELVDMQNFKSKTLTSIQQICLLYKLKSLISYRAGGIVSTICGTLAISGMIIVLVGGQFTLPQHFEAMNIQEIYSDGQSYSVGIPDPNKETSQNNWNTSDLIAATQFGSDNAIIMQVSNFSRDNSSDWENYKRFAQMCLEDKDQLKPYGTQSRSKKILSSEIYLGKVDKVGQNNISMEIFIGVNASQPITIFTTPSLVMASIINKVSDPNEPIDFTVGFNQTESQAIYAQAGIPPTQVLGIMGFVQVPALLALLSVVYGIGQDKWSGLEQIIELAGISKKSQVISTILAQSIKVIASQIIFGAVMEYVCRYNLSGFLSLCLMMAVQQCTYIAYYATLNLDQIMALEIRMRFESLFQYALPILIVSFGTSSSTLSRIAAYIEILFSINPRLAPNLVFIKLLYRARFAGIKGQDDIGMFTFASVLPEMIGITISYVVWPVLAIINQGCFQTKKADKSIQEINSNPSLRTQLKSVDLEQDAEDNDVKAESERCLKILEGKLPSEAVTVHDLQKNFILDNNKDNQAVDSNKPGISVEESADAYHKRVLQAVNGISFSLKKQESFALLGVNGAGKSTTFKMLTMNEVVSNGSITINEHSIDQLYANQQLFQGKMGYCPQNDVILNTLTVIETVKFFAQIKGVPKNFEERYCLYLAQRFELGNFLHTKATQLSGGNKRKLNTLIAMIGNPSAILLDESSAGVDPFARRRLWKTIREESANSALIVTTHSMEEAEALSNKLAIMVDGKFKCFGTTQHIKTKFGQGFTVTYKLDLDRIDKFNVENKKRATKDIALMTKDKKYNAQIGDNSMSESSFDTQTRKSMMSTATVSISLEDAINRMRQWLPIDAPRVAIDCQKELTQNGLLSGYYKRIKDGQPVDPQSMFETVLVLNEISLITLIFQKEIGHTKIIEYQNDQVTFSIDNDKNKTIGQLFAFIEEMKKEMCIKDYSAMQTSLEQIFNRFAKQDQMEKFNRRLRSSSIKHQDLDE